MFQIIDIFKLKAYNNIILTNTITPLDFKLEALQRFTDLSIYLTSLWVKSIE